MHRMGSISCFSQRFPKVISHVAALQEHRTQPRSNPQSPGHGLLSRPPEERHQHSPIAAQSRGLCRRFNLPPIIADFLHYQIMLENHKHLLLTLVGSYCYSTSLQVQQGLKIKGLKLRGSIRKNCRLIRTCFACPGTIAHLRTARPWFGPNYFIYLCFLFMQALLVRAINQFSNNLEIHFIKNKYTITLEQLSYIL